MRAFIAPAGTPISLADILVGVASGGILHSSYELLAQQLKALTGTDSCWLFSAGRAGMTTVLRAMVAAAQDPRRIEVILPAYTCWSVAASVSRAGLRPRLCDIDETTLTLNLDDLGRFDFSRVLAVVSGNLYGIPNALTELESLAAERGVFLVDDAAQALGARYGTRLVGGFGDAGILSFEKGKNISTLRGGAVVMRDACIKRSLDSAYEAIRNSTVVETLSTVLGVIAYSVFLRPRLYERIRTLRGLKLGYTTYEDDFAISRYPMALAELGARLCKRLDDMNARRVSRALRMMEALESCEGVRFVRLLESASPVYSRLPMFVDDEEQRARLLQQLVAAGVGASASYPSTLCDVPQVAAMVPAQDLECPQARRVAQRIITLPTHDYCPPDLPSIVQAACRA